MSEPLYSDERINEIAMASATFYGDIDSDWLWSRGYVMGLAAAEELLLKLRDEYEARIAVLEAQLAAANAWRTIEDDEVWMRLPDEAGGIL